MLPGFTEFSVKVNGVIQRGRHGGDPSRPALLLLHGHPETHLMWHRTTPQLAEDFFVVAPDLRGYGRSSRPSPGADHAAYSKRAMARDAVELMHQFGHTRFAAAGHDRGGRVVGRLAADHPDRLTHALVLDVAPTLDMYEGTDRSFAAAYWHWFFLIQPAPLPERLIAADPRAYVEGVMGGRHAGLAPFPAEVLEDYVAAISSEELASGLCEDYRAAAGIDLEHDRADRAAGRRTPVPLRALWAEHGVVGRLYDPLALWRQVAEEVSGRALDCGHYLPEERPEEVVSEIRRFIAEDG